MGAPSPLTPCPLGALLPRGNPLSPWEPPRPLEAPRPGGSLLAPWEAPALTDSPLQSDGCHWWDGCCPPGVSRLSPAESSQSTGPSSAVGRLFSRCWALLLWMETATVPSGLRCQTGVATPDGVGAVPVPHGLCQPDPCSPQLPSWPHASRPGTTRALCGSTLAHSRWKSVEP